MKPAPATVSLEVPEYPSMALEGRKKCLPRRNLCSLRPAVQLSDALLTGNGSLRADVYGDPFHETVSYWHELLYVPIRKGVPDLPDLTGILPKVRKLLLKGAYDEALEAMRNNWEAQGFGKDLFVTDDNRIIPMSTLSKVRAFDLQIESKERNFSNYLRSLDLLNGEVTVRFTDGDGEWLRKTVPSFSRNLIYQTVEAPKKGSLNADFAFVLPTHEDQGWSDQSLEGDFLLNVEEDRALLGCAYNPEFGSLGYTAVTRIIREGGTAVVAGNRLIVKGADKITFVTRITRYEEGYSHALAEKDFEALASEPFSAENILEENRSILGKKMERSEIHLGNADEWAYSSEELLKLQHSRDDLNGMLLEKLYDNARFYLIMDTGKLPPMFGQHNINTNLQVCSGNITGLPEEMDVYFRFYEDKMEDFRTNAKKLYGCGGALGSIHCDYNTGVFYHFSSTYPHHCWTGGLGWIYNELWGHYLVTGDKTFLKERVLPGLLEIAAFYKDLLTDTDENGKYIFYPSFSPESWTGTKRWGMVINACMDIMICREVLENLIESLETLGRGSETVQWKAMLEKMPDFLTDEEGALKEWAWKGIPEDYDHRHVSHHYAAWPGREATWEKNSELAAAIQLSNRKHAHENDSAHGIMHRLFTAIRLKDAEDATHNLKILMEHGFISRSFQTHHYPYRLLFPDMLGGVPAFLAEMTVYSEPGVVEFLPALPRALAQGSIEGICLYTAAKLQSMKWDCKAGTLRATVVSLTEQPLVFRYRYGIRSITVDGKLRQPEGNGVTVNCKAGEAVEIVLDF